METITDKDFEIYTFENEKEKEDDYDDIIDMDFESITKD